MAGGIQNLFVIVVVVMQPVPLSFVQFQAHVYILKCSKIPCFCHIHHQYHQHNVVNFWHLYVHRLHQIDASFIHINWQSTFTNGNANVSTSFFAVAPVAVTVAAAAADVVVVVVNQHILTDNLIILMNIILK